MVLTFNWLQIWLQTLPSWRWLFKITYSKSTDYFSYFLIFLLLLHSRSVNAFAWSPVSIHFNGTAWGFFIALKGPWINATILSLISLIWINEVEITKIKTKIAGRTHSVHSTHETISVIVGLPRLVPVLVDFWPLTPSLVLSLLHWFFFCWSTIKLWFFKMLQ